MEHVSRLCAFCLLVFGSLQASRPPQWGSNLATPDFNRAIERVIVAARESHPFGSLRGKSEAMGRWRPLVTIPGADRCSVTQITINSPGHDSLTYLTYSCEAIYKSQSGAVAGFDKLLDFLSTATGWEIVKDRPVNMRGIAPLLRYVHLAGEDKVRFIVTLNGVNTLILSCIGNVAGE